MADAKRTKKTTTTREAKVKPAPVPEAREEQTREWNVGGWFWGLLLIVVGGLLLLGNFGLVKLDWSNVWRIWPIAVIAAGISIMSVKTALWKFITAALMLLALVSIVLLALGTIGMPETSYSTYTSSVQRAVTTTGADVTVRAGASNIKVTSDQLDVAAKATLTSNVSKLKEDINVRDNTQYVTFSGTSTQNVWFGGGFKNDWRVVLDQNRPMRLTIDAGASQIDADVSQARLSDLTVKAGASTSVLTLGSKVSTVRVNIDSGASTVVVRVPKESGISLKIDGGLVTKHMSGMNQLNEQNYRSDNFDSATNKIEISADIGAATFTLERY